MTRRALALPSSAIWRSLIGREAARAISAREKNALNRIRAVRRRRLWLKLIRVRRAMERWRRLPCARNGKHDAQRDEQAPVNTVDAHGPNALAKSLTTLHLPRCHGTLCPP